MSVLRRLAMRAAGGPDHGPASRSTSRPGLAIGPDLLPVGLPRRTAADPPPIRATSQRPAVVAESGGRGGGPARSPSPESDPRTAAPPPGTTEAPGAVRPIPDLPRDPVRPTLDGRAVAGDDSPRVDLRPTAGGLRGPTETELPTRGDPDGPPRAGWAQPAIAGVVLRPTVEAPAPRGLALGREPIAGDGPAQTAGRPDRPADLGSLNRPRGLPPQRSVSVRIGRIDLTGTPEPPAPAVVAWRASPADVLDELAAERTWADRVAR